MKKMTMGLRDTRRTSVLVPLYYPMLLHQTPWMTVTIVAVAENQIHEALLPVGQGAHGRGPTTPGES